jgi:hypothetical protein
MIFDDQKVPYSVIMDEDLRRGGLRQRFDVILYPDTGRSFKDIVNGIDPKFAPLAFTKTPEFPSHGTPTSSADITGGIGWNGVANLEAFVKGGGVLITLGGASTLPLDGGIARDVRETSVKGLVNPGSELRTRFRRPEHPIAYGYPETTSVFREERSVYAVRRADESRIVMQYGTKIETSEGEDDPDGDPPADPEAKEDKKDDKEPPLVVSGGVKGGDGLVGKAAILDIPVGQGRVVAFDFDPIHRYQTESDFRLVWNAILNWNDLGGH